MSYYASELLEPQGTAPSNVRARRRAIVSTVAQITTVIIGAIATAWMLRLLVDRNPVRAHWTLQFMLAMASLVASCWGAYQRRKVWTKPLVDLQKLVEQVRSGEAPIEELSKIQGGVKPLVPQLQELLRDLRQQQHDLQELNQEIRQRVAQRTDAQERTIASLRKQATHDALTGLCNRRMLDEYLPKVIADCVQARSSLSVLMIDVDNFKQLNDTLGHAAGDELLRSIGQIIRSTVRENDLAFRNGGDEFVILAPDSNTKGAQALAGRLESLVDALSKTLKVAKKPRLSIGLARLDEIADPTPKNLLEKADKALYRIKSEHKGLLQPTPASLQSSASN